MLLVLLLFLFVIPHGIKKKKEIKKVKKKKEERKSKAKKKIKEGKSKVKKKRIRQKNCGFKEYLQVTEFDLCSFEFLFRFGNLSSFLKKKKKKILVFAYD